MAEPLRVLIVEDSVEDSFLLVRELQRGLGAAERRFVTAEKVVEPGRLVDEGPMQAITITRLLTDAVAEVPGGAHFTACPPDYGRDEGFQRRYAQSAADADAWAVFAERFVEVDDAGYRAAVAEEATP